MTDKKYKPRARRNLSGKPRRRPRGAASVPCPECETATRVLRTTRDGGGVIRERMCRNHHRFTTTEKTDD